MTSLSSKWEGKALAKSLMSRENAHMWNARNSEVDPSRKMHEEKLENESEAKLHRI